MNEKLTNVASPSFVADLYTSKVIHLCPSVLWTYNVDIKFIIYIESRKICRTFDICSAFDGIESACLQFTNLKAKPFAYVGCIAAYR